MKKYSRHFYIALGLVLNLSPFQVHATDNLLLIVDDYRTTVSQATISTWMSSVPTLNRNTTNTSEHENIYLCAPEDEPCSLRSTIRSHFYIDRTLKPRFDKELIKDSLEGLLASTLTQPQNAVLTVSNGKIVAKTPHVAGRTVDFDVAAQHVQSALEKDEVSVELSSVVTLPDIRSDNLTELGLVELLGEGRSNFAGSPQNRRHNIAVAASNYDDLLLAPGEEFSFVKHLGPVNASSGYKEELVIKQNETTKEYGGGICQVSTTIFRAAILTGMEITQRRNHSYAVKYYEPVGFDATIYLPAPDIRFKNNTGKYILIQPSIEGDEMVVRFYGTSDGRTVVMDGPHITEKNDDGSLKTYFTQTVTTTSGETIIDDTFYSHYKSPDLYPKQGDVSTQLLTEKPDNWSKKEWKAYQQEHGI